MTIEDYLSKECGVNPNEKIDTNDDGYWKLKDLIAGYIEEEELVKNLTIPVVINCQTCCFEDYLLGKEPCFSCIAFNKHKLKGGGIKNKITDY